MKKGDLCHVESCGFFNPCTSPNERLERYKMSHLRENGHWIFSDRSRHPPQMLECQYVKPPQLMIHPFCMLKKFLISKPPRHKPFRSGVLCHIKIDTIYIYTYIDGGSVQRVEQQKSLSLPQLFFTYKGIMWKGGKNHPLIFPMKMGVQQLWLGSAVEMWWTLPVTSEMQTRNNLGLVPLEP